MSARGGTGGTPVRLLLFSRAPVAGQTKTRLIPALGAAGARDFHAACINDLIALARDWLEGLRARGVPAAGHLFITPPGSQTAFRLAGVDWPGDFHLHNQRGETLGRRMAQAMVRARAEDPGESIVLLVGTDLPLLCARHLDAALEALTGGGAELVFGPTPDGGYYLVGLRGGPGLDPGPLFDLAGWGGGAVLEDSLALAGRLGLRAALVDPLPDADTPEDLPLLLAHPLAAELARARPPRESLRLLRQWRERGGPHPAP